MKVPRSMRTTGTDLERLLFNSGAAEKPDTYTVDKAARGLDLFPKALLVGGVLAFVVRNARQASVAIFSVVPLGVVAIVAMTLIHRSSAGVPAVPAHSAPGTTVPSHEPAAVAPTVPPAVEQPPSNSIDTTLPPHDAAASRSKAHVVGFVPRSSTPADNLGEQAAMLNRARALLEAGRASAALAAIDDYDRRFRSGPLSEEALLLRIEGLAENGERNAATDLGRRFLMKYPTSVHVDQVVALLGSLSP